MTKSEATSDGSTGKAVRRTIVGIVLLGLGVFALYTWGALTYVYAEGEHAGYLVRVARRGAICKTWEGEIDTAPVPGAVPEKIYFSVRSDAVAHELDRYIGHHVKLRYERHVGVPTSCFGETEFFVSGVTPVE